MKFNFLLLHSTLFLLFLFNNFSFIRTECAANTNGCSECSTEDPTECDTCSTNYYYSDGSCVSCPVATPNSFEGSESANDCFACSAGKNNCITCSGSVSEGCSTCAADTYRSSGTCESCPSSAPYSPEGSTSSESCHACTDSRHCRSCSDNKDVCTKCALSYYLDDSSCFACPRSCPNCVKGSVCKSESNHLGAILGGVLGGIAGIIGILVLIYRNDVVPKMKEEQQTRSKLNSLFSIMNRVFDNEHYQAMADHLYNQNEREKSVVQYKKAILTSPDRSRAYYDLGFILSQEKRYHEAIRYFKKAANLQPYSSRVYRSWGVALYWLGNYQEAEVKLEEARRIYSSCTETDYWLGEVLLKFSHYQEVIAICERVERMDGNNLKIYRPWIAAMLDLGKTKEAKSLLENLKKKNPQSHRTYFYIGIVFEYKGMFEEAIECYEKAYEINPTFDWALNNWGYVMVTFGDYDSAIEKFKKVLEMNSGEFRTYLNLSILYYLQNKRGEACEVLKKGFDSQKDNRAFDKQVFITEVQEEFERIKERVGSEKAMESEKLKTKALEFAINGLKNDGHFESEPLLDSVASG